VLSVPASQLLASCRAQVLALSIALGRPAGILDLKSRSTAEDLRALCRPFVQIFLARACGESNAGIGPRTVEEADPWKSVSVTKRPSSPVAAATPGSPRSLC
jgi:hypothetical protein